jgi:CDP-diacylglycerol---serine O-phosphatidyltransferase
MVPSLFTLANMFCGFIAIVYFSNDLFFKGALFILAAGLFDMLDGIMARLTHSTSEFGVELDSLCDAISFGVAPAYMLYKVYFFTLGDIGILFAALPALAGVIRLARFNVQVISFDDKNYFRGMPIPAAAIYIISYIIFYHQGDLISQNIKEIMIFIVTISASFAMISTIKFDNLPRPNLKDIKKRPLILSFTLVAVIGSFITKGMFIFPFMLFYLIVSSLRHLLFWIKKNREDVDEIDETEESKPGPFDS